MEIKKIFILAFTLTFILTGCRDYTAAGRKNADNTTDENSLAQAVEEENQAMRNAGIITGKGKKLAKEINAENTYSYSSDKQGNITLLSESMEISLTEKDVKTIYFVIFDSHPLENEKISNELFSVIKTISAFLNTEYNEDAVKESLNNVDYSPACNNYDNDYSDSLYLFSNLWNDGTRDCIDFRIYPKS